MKSITVDKNRSNGHNQVEEKNLNFLKVYPDLVLDPQSAIEASVYQILVNVGENPD